MRAIANARNVESYTYWHNSHWMAAGNPPLAMATVWNQCKHGVSYFLAWHRGFLYYFEQTLRKLSGYPAFALPYWDYYKNPKLPAIYTAPKLEDGSPNPLYWKRRTGTSVEGLSFASFENAIVKFPFGPEPSFEYLVERNPHNRVHNQVGGSMGEVATAPADPIFYAHHANIDRYWSCWLAAGGKRAMPAPDDLWWDQRFFYNTSLTWNVSVRAMNDTRALGYTYSDLRFPKPAAGASLPARPPVAFTGSENVAGPIALTLEPVSVAIALEPQLARAGKLALVLDGVRLTPAGAMGGYDVGVYLDLPEVRVPVSQELRYLAGEFGPFELTMGAMPGMAVSAAGRVLRFAAAPQQSTAVVSFVPSGLPQGVSRRAVLASIDRIRIVPA